MIHFICKYTPTELLSGFGETCEVLDEMPENFDLSDQVIHPNLCGFGKSIIQAVWEGKVRQLILVNCCDTIRRIYDVIAHSGRCEFLFLMDLPHEQIGCAKDQMFQEVMRLKKAYETFSGKSWDAIRFIKAFSQKEMQLEPFIGILGVRVGKKLEEKIERILKMPVQNFTCVQNRNLDFMPEEPVEKGDEEILLRAYAHSLLRQIPCRRMNDVGNRKVLFRQPNLRGILYHTIKFCDYYGLEYADIKDQIDLPMLKIESDYTFQSEGQMLTRLEAFTESLNGVSGNIKGEKKLPENFYVAGVDSGSASTDVVILNQDRKIIAAAVVPTGAGAASGAEKSLETALQQAGLRRDDLVRTVTTGYGRSHIGQSDQSITEITCHAKGAFYLNPDVRTIIDIGGQDSKVIRIDEKGNVKNFVMNDKCAAGTGRFLEMMSRILGLSLEEISKIGLNWKENITISNMCTVFAESEVVSLIAQNKSVADIVHGLNHSVASKTVALVHRLGLEGVYMMTGGVAKNQGVVKAIEEKLESKLFVSDRAQLCGALGAALFALE